MKTYSLHNGVGTQERQERREIGKRKEVKRWKKNKGSRHRGRNPATKPWLIGDEKHGKKITKKETGNRSPNQSSDNRGGILKRRKVT